MTHIGKEARLYFNSGLDASHYEEFLPGHVQELYQGNDNIIKVTGLRDAESAAYLNGATVTVTLLDENDVEVGGETWPLAMNYVAASDGDYTAILTAALEVTVGQRITARIDVDAGAQGVAVWEMPTLVKRRT